MRAKQKDNSPIRGRRNPASKKLLFKNVFTVWLGRPRIRASAWKVGRLPPFSACVRPPPTAPRRFIWRRRNRSRRARHGVLRATRPPTPVSLAAGACVQTRVGRGACAAEGSRESVFPGSLFKPFRPTPGGEGESQRKSLAELLRPLRSTRLL